MIHLQPALLRTLRYRMMILLDLQLWDEAAMDVVRMLNYAVLEEKTYSEPLRQEWEAFLERLRALSNSERAQLYATLGEWTEVVRGLVDE